VLGAQPAARANSIETNTAVRMELRMDLSLSPGRWLAGVTAARLSETGDNGPNARCLLNALAVFSFAGTN
jgi:hypothetical protein